jgi:hypothetical protein
MYQKKHAKILLIKKQHKLSKHSDIPNGNNPKFVSFKILRKIYFPLQRGAILAVEYVRTLIIINDRSEG